MSNSNSMWGGRFANGPDAVMQEINASIPFDKRFWQQDITGSKAHADMLASCNIISNEDNAAIQSGLDQISNEYSANGVPEDLSLEDIHMTIETRLNEIAGEAARRLHTARSRNDQVATDFRLWVRDAIDEIIAAVSNLQSALLTRAGEHSDSIMPGFTHLQVAQPITLGHHLMAYYEMLKRDQSRLSDCRKRVNEMPLGCAALAGTGFTIDRNLTSDALGFNNPMANSLDAVSDRDFAIEFLSTITQISLHLSRLAEEVIIWASQPYGFVKLSDQWSTGSSIMPQKRNPDAAELIRGHAGRILAAQNALMVTMKGLPLAYSKDMQNDKPPVFEGYDLIGLCLAAMTGMVETLTFDTQKMHAVAASGFSTATDLADWLVRDHNMPFRDAHHVTGAAVKLCEDRGAQDLFNLTIDDLVSITPALAGATLPDLSVEGSVNSRISAGGTAPIRVKEAIAKALKDMKS